jgi:hypothetical protein
MSTAESIGDDIYKKYLIDVQKCILKKIDLKLTLSIDSPVVFCSSMKATYY